MSCPAPPRADDARTKATWQRLGFSFTATQDLQRFGVTHHDLLHMDNTVQASREKCVCRPPVEAKQGVPVPGQGVSSAAARCGAAWGLPLRSFLPPPTHDVGTLAPRCSAAACSSSARAFLPSPFAGQLPRLLRLGPVFPSRPFADSHPCLSLLGSSCRRWSRRCRRGPPGAA